MTAYTLFSQGSVSGAQDGGSNPAEAGNWFQLSENASLTGIWFYSGATSTQLPTHCEIWTEGGSIVSGTQNASPSWSGAAGSGWIECSYDGSVTLDASTWYCVAAGSTHPADTFLWATSNYWTTGAGSGGITNGPLSAPNAASAPLGNGYQSTFNANADFPDISGSGVCWWVDVQVTVSSNVTGTGAVTEATETVDGTAAETIGSTGAVRGAADTVAATGHETGVNVTGTGAITGAADSVRGQQPPPKGSGGILPLLAAAGVV